MVLSLYWFKLTISPIIAAALLRPAARVGRVGASAEGLCPAVPVTADTTGEDTTVRSGEQGGGGDWGYEGGIGGEVVKFLNGSYGRLLE